MADEKAAIEEARLAAEAEASEALVEVPQEDNGDLAFNTPSDNFPSKYSLSKDLEAHQDLGSSVVLSKDRSKVVTGGWDNTIKVWDAQTGEPIATLKGHESLVNSIAISNDGKTLVSASDDETLRVWDLDTGKSILSLTGHDDWVNSVAVSDDGQTLVSGSSDKTVKIWQLQ